MRHLAEAWPTGCAISAQGHSIIRNVGRLALRGVGAKKRLDKELQSGRGPIPIPVPIAMAVNPPPARVSRSSRLRPNEIESAQVN